MGESTAELEKPVAAPMIFIIVLALQFLSRYFEINKKKGSTSSEDMQLRAEIKQLLKEASALSQPSTFAQAAKLRRLATAKEKELAKNQEIHNKEAKLSHDSYTKGLTVLQVLTYFLLIIWFWRIPVAAISKQLVQPFGKMLSWRGGGPANENVMVGIIPWLILSTRVGKSISRRILK
ncbi:protein GET1-like [Solanum dulcamara]|uniref:protein GET1-like n=1 Tax=Solanum dulcamara TaxID=45834 RepID=UPI002485B575|nr:protein GET1-like [Solanum dulcamara]